jgi:DNA polymerase-3 subunit epsilon
MLQKGLGFKMRDFIAIDFETATYKPESAISIGLVKFRDFEPVDSYYSLIRPPRMYIRSDFTDIHGLTVDDVKDAQDFEYLWEHEIKGFIGSPSIKARTLLAAHNAQFDMRVLRAALEYYCLPVPAISYFCTCWLSKKAWPAFPSHSLANLAEQFGIVYEAHNALADAETCGKLVQLAAEKTGSEVSLAALLKAAGVRKKRLM